MLNSVKHEIDGGDPDKAKVVGSFFVVTSCHSSILLDATEIAFDAVAFFVEVLIIIDRLFASFARWDARLGPVSLDCLTVLLGVISIVGQNCFGEHP